MKFAEPASHVVLDPAHSRVCLYIIWLILVACVIRLWIMPLSSSFWVDEAATAFVVQHGAGDPTLHIAPQVPASIYYALPKTAEALFGFSEVAYRIPSLLAMLIALAIIKISGDQLIYPEAGWLVVFSCLALRGFNDQAADARPYGLGTCVAALCLTFLTRWLRSRGWADGGLFVVTAALLWRVHLVFWPFYFVMAAVTAVAILRKETAVSFGQAALLFGAVAVSLAPVAATAWFINRSAEQHVIAERPTFRVLVNALHLGMIGGFLGAGSLLAHFRNWPVRKWLNPGYMVWAIAGWWLCQPVLLFLFSWITNNSVFVPRYLSLSLPGAALAAVAVTARFVPGYAWRPLSALCGTGVLLLFGGWNHAAVEHHGSKWREAAAAINSLEGNESRIPVICPSPFVEAQPPEWNPGYSKNGFLYSHLAVYPVRGPLYLFPFQTSPEAERFATDLAGSVLPAAGRFVVYGGDRNVRFWTSWFEKQPALLGWKSKSLGSFGDVDAVIVEKQ